MLLVGKSICLGSLKQSNHKHSQQRTWNSMETLVWALFLCMRSFWILLLVDQMSLSIIHANIFPLPNLDPFRSSPFSTRSEPKRRGATKKEGRSTCLWFITGNLGLTWFAWWLCHPTNFLRPEFLPLSIDPTHFRGSQLRSTSGSVLRLLVCGDIDLGPDS